jgi:PAP2 superfamily
METVSGSKAWMIADPLFSGMRGVDRVRSWLAVRHSLPAELLVVVGLYALYESTRGVVAGRRAVALRHADDVAAIERSLHMFVEGGVERTAERVSGLTSTLGVLYLSLHLALTGLLLLWLHQRRPHAYPFFRTTLLLASAVALIGYLTFPTAPPRLSVDLLNSGTDRLPVNIDKGFVSDFYNPYAAVPSMHAAYALVVGAALLLQGRHWLIRVAGLTYPLVVVFIVVATGNHFLFDVGTGALADVLAATAAVMMLRGAQASVAVPALRAVTITGRSVT